MSAYVSDNLPFVDGLECMCVQRRCGGSLRFLKSELVQDIVAVGVGVGHVSHPC